MKEIEVSVCIITYRQEEYIRQCLDSVFMQKTNFEFEVIVGEDASPDNTREILLEYKEKYGDKLVLVLHDKNQGVSKNARSVYAKVRGKYIANVEGDDFWTDEYKLQKQYDVLEAHPEYSAACTNFMSVSSQGDILKSNYLNLKTDIVKTMDDWIKEGYSIHTCTIFRRNIFPETGEEYVKLKTAKPTMGDLITFTLLYDAGNIYVFNEVMAAHRAAGSKDIDSFSMNSKKDPIKYTYMYKEIIELLDEYLDHKYDFTPKIIDKVARTKLGKILRNAPYKRRDMKLFLKQLSYKDRLMVNVKLTQRIIKGGWRKVLKIVCKKEI